MTFFFLNAILSKSALSYPFILSLSFHAKQGYLNRKELETLLKSIGNPGTEEEVNSIFGWFFVFQ